MVTAKKGGTTSNPTKPWPVRLTLALAIFSAVLALLLVALLVTGAVFYGLWVSATNSNQTATAQLASAHVGLLADVGAAVGATLLAVVTILLALATFQLSRTTTDLAAYARREWEAKSPAATH